MRKRNLNHFLARGAESAIQKTADAIMNSNFPGLSELSEAERAESRVRLIDALRFYWPQIKQGVECNIRPKAGGHWSFELEPELPAGSTTTETPLLRQRI